MDLSEFLLARIAEDEAWATSAWREQSHAGGCDVCGASFPRLLAECEAKRRIVEHHRSNDDDWPLCVICTEVGPDAQGWPCLTLHLLALPYADHEDYDEAWRP